MFIRSPQEFAVMVIDQRKKLGITQAEVASRVGLKQKTISAFENKPENTKISTLFLILSAVNLDMNVIPKNAESKSDWQHEW
ncbi:helix-turn-helix domain-containing protein [Candidatus Berkiella aquae]|uniref:Antitoxin HipB n=1 Tax=Candidatus Berkiella aquae TaxID=295108 RepID=A0A0Q9YI60_9GAMM|nr:helix-turn-helix domain-containing protein [Candidatus Berkiella aquae]MCS5712298.1 helix-turn-helix domain-containing protein [Candidatus Berkiella aquae]